jgi:hypothetical protein
VAMDGAVPAGVEGEFDPFTAAAAEKANRPPPTTAVLFDVALPSGATIKVRTQDEADQMRRRTEMYEEQFSLDNVADLAELDRCVLFELDLLRISAWLSLGHDYDDGKIDEDKLRQRLREASAELRQVKKGLMVDRVAREKTTGKGSVPERWAAICDQARQFGLHRNNQAAKAHELAMQLISLMDLRTRTTAKEKRMLRCSDEDFIELDTAFRSKVQKMWRIEGGSAA